MEVPDLAFDLGRELPVIECECELERGPQEDLGLPIATRDRMSERRAELDGGAGLEREVTALGGLHGRSTPELDGRPVVTGLEPDTGQLEEDPRLDGAGEGRTPRRSEGGSTLRIAGPLERTRDRDRRIDPELGTVEAGDPLDIGARSAPVPLLDVAVDDQLMDGVVERVEAAARSARTPARPGSVGRRTVAAQRSVSAEAERRRERWRVNQRSRSGAS